MKWTNLFKSHSGDTDAPLPDLTWIDTFIDRVRPYIFVRLEDNLLIKRPNAAFKLNPMGARLLVALLGGQSIAAVTAKTDALKQNQILNFFQAIKLQLEGKLNEYTCNPAVLQEPFKMNFNTLPVLSEVALTYRCNIKCRFCYAGCNCTSNPVQSNEEMTPDQVKRILDKIYHEAKVPSVSFTGGEPTLVPYLPELIAYARSLDMRVNLITNGIALTAHKAKTLADAGLNSAQVSLEGTTAPAHDTVVQHPGAFEKSVAAVSYLHDAGVAVHTNTTITRLNLEECRQMPRFVKEQLGRDKFSMNLVIPSGSGGINDELIVKYSEIGPVLKQIMAESETWGVEFMWYSPVPMCMFNSVAQGLGNKGCSACDGLLSVAADGSVLPCSSYADSVGNLLTTEFSTVWQSSKARYYRFKEFAHPICKSCEHFDICNGGCPLYWQHLGFDELEENNG